MKKTITSASKWEKPIMDLIDITVADVLTSSQPINADKADEEETNQKSWDLPRINGKN